MNLEPYKARLAAATEGQQRVHKLEWREGANKSVAVAGDQIWTITRGWGGVWLGLDNGMPSNNGNHHIVIKWIDMTAHYEQEESAAKSLAQALQDVIDGVGEWHAPTDIAELVAEVERLQYVIEGGSTTKPTHRGMVTGCTNPGHLHLADAQAAFMKASRCTFETKEGE